MKELVKKAAECQEDSLDCITKANLDVPKTCNREKEKKTYNIYTCNLGLVLPHKVHGEKAPDLDSHKKAHRMAQSPLKKGDGTKK
jgi:hypothetical protein